MKKIIKNTIVFASVLILSLMTSIIFMGSRVKAADLGDGSFSVKYDDIDEYYGEKAPEYQNGYLFAGWYTDEMCTSSYVRKDGEGVTTFYAKFVPQDVLSVKAQHAVALHNKVLADTDTGSIRFVTATDSNNYNEVGLHVEGTIGSHTLDTDYKVGTIYSYLYVVGDTTNDKSNPVAASAVFETDAAEYFAPHAFKINFTQFDDDFTITPYWITPDGVRVDGVARTRNMIENLEEYSYAEVNGRAYYTSDNLPTIYTLVDGETAFAGTEEEPIVMTVLKNVVVDAAVTVEDKNVTIVNKADTEVTISRGSDYAGNLLVATGGGKLQLGTASSEETGKLIVDGGSASVSGRTIYITGANATFILQKNATLQNALSTASGAAICNKGTCKLYGSMLNNQSSSAGSEDTFSAGAILQCRGSKTLTIYGGTYTGNKNTGTYGGGGLIGTQITNTTGSAGAITIKGGEFSGNEAARGGVIYTYTDKAVTIEDGTFDNNKATGTNGGVICAAPTAGDIIVSGGTFTNNKAIVSSNKSNGGVICAEAGTAADGAAKIIISAGTFQNNQASLGGVVAVMNYAELEITGGSFTNNESTRYGGGVVYVCVATAKISGATMTGNCAPSSNAAYYGGGAIAIHRASTVTLENCTIHGNTHDGRLSDESKNINGCDITFSGGNSGNTSELILADSSFTGIVGHMSSTEKATLQVKFSDGTIDTVDYTKSYSADYEQPALVENVTYQVLLVSDMHYTTNLTESEYKSQYSLEDLILTYGIPYPADVCGPAFGYSQDDKIGEMFADINGYIESNGAINSLMLLGDISIDNKGYSNLKDDFLELFKETYLTEDLAYDWYALAGDHDSYTNDEWKAIMGYDRQYSVEVGNAVFIMLDNFAATHATSNSGSEYDGIDIDFLTTELAKYPDKSIFLCSHYYAPNKNTENDTAFMALLNQYDNIVCMFRGHSHNSAYYSAGSLGGFPIIDIGGYAYNDKAYVTNDDGTKNFNVFDKDYAWGYQVLQWNNSTAHVYHVKNARDYTDYADVVHNYTGAIEDDRFIGLR